MLYALFFLLFSRINCEKIVIIGAGASGLAAATRLIEKNVTDFEIFEAESRLGGRIHSIYLLGNDGKSGKFVDLGGEYVGGAEDNAVFQVSKNDLHSRGEMRLKNFDSDGEINREFSEEIAEFKQHLAGNFKNSAPISIRDAFMQRYNSTILEKYKNSPNVETAKNYIETCEYSYLLTHGAFDWSKILLINNHKICKGGDFSWNGKGYKFFLDTLMRKFGDEHRLNLYPIFYSTIVTKIVWDNNVEIYTKNGRKYEANHVIFTPSVGVLKENHERLFVPKLPQNKINAIETIGFEGAVKVILQYREKWWNDGFSGFTFVWKENETLQDVNLWMRSFRQLLTIPGVDDTLVAWFSGAKVPEIEKLGITKIKNGINFVIGKFLGKHYNVTEPRIIIPSSWYSNPNFRGVYSHETLASGNRPKQVQEDLGETLKNSEGKPVVFFAGEHTHKTHFSTVHGAVESGYRAADELIEYLTNY